MPISHRMCINMDYKYLSREPHMGKVTGMALLRQSGGLLPLVYMATRVLAHWTVEGRNQKILLASFAREEIRECDRTNSMCK